MTFRTRMAPKPTRRRARRDDNRRAIYITLSFTLAIVVALSMVGGIFVAGYYSAHLVPVASVNGQVINKDQVRDRANLDLARYQRQIEDYTTLRNQGKIASDEYSTLTSSIQSSESLSTIYTGALTELTKEAELEQYASKNNITVSDQAVADQIKTDATVPELRHVKIIAVAPEVTIPAVAITATDINAAQTKIEGYLNEVNTGTAWDTVATESNSTSTGGGSIGDLGLTSKDSLSVDQDLADAIFSLAKPNDVTAIFKESDGIFRFATVTSIVPEYFDADWQTSIDSGASASLYQSVARAEATQTAVQNVINAKYVSGPTVQRNVLEIGVTQGYGQPGDGEEVKISIMVFAPNNDEANASSVDPSDPAWTDALNRATAAVTKLRADPSQFATMAKDSSINDDTQFGSDIPWIPSSIFAATTASGATGLGMPNVQAAVFASGLTPGTILDPIQETSVGYVVVEFQGLRPPPDQRIADALLKVNSGSDFAAVAATDSMAIDAPTGGNLGWVSPYMLNPDKQAAIFQTPVGRVSNITTGTDGIYIYKILDEQTRTPDAKQQSLLKKVVYSNWFTELQANTLLWQDSAAVSAMAPATPS